MARNLCLRGVRITHPETFSEDAARQEQIQSFLGWQSARSDSSLAAVPEMWEYFLEMLEENVTN